MATYTAPTTRTTGALISASIWNTDIVENLKYFKDAPVFDGDISVGDDLLLTSTGAVINFASGDVTVTHSSNTLTFAGAASGYIFNDGNLFVRSSATTGSNAWGTGQIKAEQDTFTGISCVTHDNTDSNAGFMQILRSRGTQASPTAVTSTQYIGAYSWAAYDGVNAGYRTAAEIQGYVDGTVSSGVVPGSLRFAVTNSSGTLVERLRITSGGNVAIGATARLYLDGTAGTGDTYIVESSANVLDLVSGGNVGFRVTSSQAQVGGTHDLVVQAAKKLYLDGGGDTYIHENSSNVLITVVGGTNLFASVNNPTKYNFSYEDFVVDSGKKLYLDGLGDTYLSEAAANIIRVTVGGVSAVQWDTTGMYLNTPPPTTASAANAFVGSTADYLRRSTSSIRYKHDIATLDTHDALAAVMAMRPVTYRGRTDEDQRRFVGFIAEEMQEIAPLLCTYDDGGESGTPNYVTYDRVTAYLVAVVQQQQQKIAALEARIH